MYTFLIIIHLFVSFIMIGAILLQAGKGAEIGAAFGGSSQTLFGSRGAATFLSKMTVGAAIIFMLTSLSLAFLSRERAGERSIMSGTATESAPAKPAPPATIPSAQPSAANPAPASATAQPVTPVAPPPAASAPSVPLSPAAPPSTAPDKK